MIHARAPLAALMAGAALLIGAACGSEEDEPAPGIPRAAADQLSRELDLLQERIDVTRERSAPGSCSDVEAKSYPEIQRILDALPGDTDPEVRRALERSIDRLKELADAECSELVEEIEKRREDTPPPVTTPPPAPTPAPTPEPTETQEEPKDKEKEKDKDDQQDQPQDDGEDNGGGVGPNDQGPPGQGGGGQPAPPASDG